MDLSGLENHSDSNNNMLGAKNAFTAPSNNFDSVKGANLTLDECANSTISSKIAASNKNMRRHL